MLKRTRVNRFRNSLKIILLQAGLFVGISAIGQKSERGLTIGDRLPNIEIGQLINSDKTSGNISDYAGKAMVLDFWAPWCGPCIANFPKLDSIQRKYNKDLQVLLVTKEPEEFSKRTILNLNKKYSLILPSVVNDKEFSAIFRHKVIPHYIWIDKQGIIKAITGREDVTSENVRKLIAGETLSFTIKQDEPFMKLKGDMPWFANQHIGDQQLSPNEIMSYSVLTRFLPGVEVGSAARGEQFNWVRYTNVPILWLYKFSLGEFKMEYTNNNRVILEGFDTKEDSLSIGRFKPEDEKGFYEKREQYYYNYEMKISDVDAKFNHSIIWKSIQSDLNSKFASFNISGKLEVRKIKILSLIRTSEKDLIKTKGERISDQVGEYYLKLEGVQISELTDRLQGYFLREDAPPIVDRTNYKGDIDIELNCNLNKIDEVNKELEKYHLKLVESYADTKMIVITKNKK